MSAEGLLWLYLFQFGLMALSLEPGFLDFDNLPDTNFTCVGKVIGGYYADLETNCQMFHVCTIGQADEPMDIRFLCLNGTVFDQETRVCERIDEVDCSKSEQYYSLNLELYGNSGPILEETPEVAQETEPPSIIIKSTTSTLKTTTSTKRPSNRPISSPYYTTNRPPSATTTPNQQHVISTHHFPVNAPDIRFNPEEINISLNPGAPPDIRTKHYLQQSFSDNSHEIVKDNLDSDDERSVKGQKPDRSRDSSTTSPKSIYNLENSDNKDLSQNSEIDFDISGEGYQTELPRQQQFLIQTNSFRHSQSFPPNINHNSNQYHHQHYHSTTAKQQNNYNQDPNPTTHRTIYLHSLKPPKIHQHHHFTTHHHHNHHRTEKPPQRVQIPIPLLPTLPPLTFSSPAPFTLQRHIENKRYTKDHQVPPRIIISASASVSDASGKRLNYSLGTIGAGQILKTPPASYDDYKEGDVGLDPFYYDVPKVNQRRRKRRSTSQQEKINPFDIIKNEKEAVDVLKFIFTWYQSHQATATVPSVTSPVSADLIHKINYELAGKDTDSTFLTDSSETHFTNAKEPASTESLRPKYRGKELKQRGRFSMIGGYRNLHSKSTNTNKDQTSRQHDNYVNKNIGEKYKEEEIFESKNIPNVATLNEKMDDAEATVIKDLKEVYFNPYDYVDDNYEGVVYKETNPNKNETLNLDSGKKIENIESLSKHDSSKGDSVDPNVVLQLYNYFNLNKNITSPLVKNTKDTPKEYNNSTVNTKHHETDSIDQKENKSSENILLNPEIAKITKEYSPESTNKEDKSGEIDSLFDHTTTKSNQYTLKSNDFKNIELGKTNTKLNENVTTNLEQYNIETKYTDHDSKIDTILNYDLAENIKHDNASDKNINSVHSLDDNKVKPNKEPVRFTEINVVSEVSQEEIDQQSISPSSTTYTTTTETPVSRRRGRGRQRQYNHISEQQKNKKGVSDSVSHSNNSFGVDNLTHPNRDYNKNTDNYILKILKEQNHLSRPVGNRGRKRGRSRFKDYYQTSSSTTTLSSTVVDIVTEESTKVPITNIYATSDTATSEFENDYTYAPSTENTDINNEETIKIAKDSDKNIQNKTNDTKIIDEINSNSSKNKKFYKDNGTDFVPSINIENNIETATETYATEESFTEKLEEDTTHLKLLKNIKFSESADNDNMTPEINTQLPSDENKVSQVKTTEDPSYLVKLLRYYVNHALTPVMETVTPVSQEVTYEPITENKTPSTEETILNIHNRINENRNKNENRNRHQHRNNVQLPTLRDIYTQTSDYDDSKASGSKITHNLPTTSTSNTIKETKLYENNISTTYDEPTTELPSTLDFQKNVDQYKKSDLLKRLNYIEQNLAAFDNLSSVTDPPIADTTATTPYVSFESPESYGTTIPSTTIYTLSDSLKELTENFELTTESTYSTLPEHTSQSNYHFYDDIFVVPESTEGTKKLKTNQKTYKPLNSSRTDNTYDKKDHNLSTTEKYMHLEPKVTKTLVSEYTIPDFTTPIYTTEIPYLPEEEKGTFEQIEKEEVLNKSDYTTLLPDVEIQKSISLPILVLQSHYDNLNEDNNAQDINDLASITSSSEIPDTVHNKETFKEFIQEIEASTKSVLAKDDQIKLTYTEGYGVTATETVPDLEEIYEVSTQAVMTEVQHNATEIIFVKELNESSKTSENESSSRPLTSVNVDTTKQVNSSHLLQVIVETTTTKPITTTLVPHYTRRTRPPRKKTYNSNRNLYGRHRFSTEIITNKPTIYEEAQYDKNHINAQNITDAPLYRSATPTRSELKKVSLHTTPLSSKNSSSASKTSKRYVFNCFGKETNRFYSDPRDCRLFHYCTQGYSKNQLLDLKFVCDQKTFFDENKLICTKVKPSRCL